jgi:predicted porin
MQNRDYNSTVAVLALSTFVGALGVTTQSLAAATPIGPAIINAGPVAITPTVGTEIKYRDNIYLQDNDTTDSWIYIARPAVNAALQDRDNLYQLDYRGEGGWYQEDSTGDRNDYFDNTLSGNAHMEFSERWITEVFGSWAALHEDRGTGLSEGFIGGVIPKPIEFDQGDVGASLQYGSDEGVGRLLLSAGYMDRQYQNFEELTRSRDREETTFAATFFYPVAPKTDVLVEYAYKDIEYPNPFQQGPALDSDENSLWAGAEWEMTPNLTSSARLGYVDKDFKDSERKDWDGLGWSVSLAMQPREQDTVFVESSRRPEETTLQGDFIKRTNLTARWTHDWSDRVYTELSALYGKDEYEQSINDREDDIYNISFRVGYEFRRWANIYAGYSYDDKDSNIDGLSYKDNIVMVGVEFSL